MTVTEMFELRPSEGVNLAGQDTGRDHLSNTQLDKLLACQQRYALHYEARLRPAVIPVPLELGIGFAHALEVGDPQAGFDRVISDRKNEAEAAAGNIWVKLPSQEETEIGATIVLAASSIYLERYGQHNQTREVELRARIRNPAVGGRVSPTHDLLARVDAIDTEARILIEDKLASSQAKSSLERRVRLDRQVSIECYLLWRCLGWSPERIHYRMTLKPGIKRRQNESHDEYLARLVADYQARPDFYLVEEPPVTRDHADFLRLEQELWRWAEMVRDARRDGIWPRNTAACQDFGGCRYAPLCCGEPGAEHQFIQKTTTHSQEKQAA